MWLERLLQISISVLVSLSTLLLGMGERNSTLPVVAVIVSVSSLYLTDIKGWLRLNTTVTNIAGLVALAATWHDWDYYAGESQLLSIANLLIYLQFVLLYRQKNLRNYWLLILLSLLQVAVASALNMSIFFGLLLLIYMFIGLLTLALFSIYREYFYSQELWKPWRANEVAEAERAAAERRRWPLAAHAAVFAGLPPEAEADAGLTWGWVRQILKLGVLTVVLSSMMFFGLPRVGKAGRWRAGNTRILRTVGFSESVTLGELGEAYQNDNALMQVWFSDVETGEPYRVAGDSPLFRGALLYNYHQGQWHRRTDRFELARISPLQKTSLNQLPADTPLVKQKIILQPRDDQTLFSVFPVFRGDSDSKVSYSAENEQLYRPSYKQSEPFTYELYTSGFRDHLYSMAVPATRKLSQQEYQLELLRTPRDLNGEDMLPGLRELAAQLVSDIPPFDRERQARTLEMYLRDLTKFRYSLKGVERDPNLDPVEDFLTKHPVGHCEYFASALTLMLRSVKIPARMAIGFKGGEWNDAGKYYQVRELHAHTWVEAWLSPENLPPNLRNSEMAKQNGAWLILDPTPAGSDADRYEILGLYSWKQLFDLSQFVWSNYVLGMDSQRQQESIYQPLIARIEEQLKQLADEEYRQQLWERLGQKLGGQRFGLSAGWLSWQGLLVAATAVLVVTGGYRGSKRAIKPVRRWVRKRWDRTLGRGGARVDFYERFEALLARRQWVRAASQTPREFALSLGGQFAESSATKHAAVLPRRVVEAFYRVRFGGQRLDNSESQAVEQAISDLADALKAAESNTDSSA